MKKNKSLLLLLALLVVLGGCYFGITRYQTYKADQESAAEEAEAEANEIKYTSFDSVTSIKTNVSGEELSFSLKDDSWVYDGDNDFPLTQSYLTTMANDLCYSVATRELENPDALSDYGLETPQYTITASDGTTTTNLHIGNATDDGYYMTVDDTGKVYTIGSTLITDTGYALDDMITLDTFPGFTSSNVTKVDILRADGGETLYTAEDNAEDITAIAGGLGAFECTDYAGYFGDNTDLTQYGLDDGTATVVQITYTKSSDTTDSTADADSEDTDTSDSSDDTSTESNTTTTTEDYTMYIGNLDDTGENYYVRLQDSQLIYRGSVEIVNNILNQ
ncbi:MAG: DUF4340 domain-containing protein [Lachnospiraceae bacterium]|nr:DUF4340 domain-containing protein [Lachnospiraceae bacterium]